MLTAINLQRKIRASLSYFFGKTEKESFEINKIINKTYNLLLKNLYIQRIEKKKTHKIFSQEIFYLIKNKNFLNFLQNTSVQKMFFIHNRLFLIKYFLKMFFSKKWNMWKKLLKESGVGNPVRYFLLPFTSGNKIFQAYHLKKYEDTMNVSLKNFDLVFEFGGGYGNMATNLYKLNKNTKYFIFDTFEVSLLQYYYLRRNNLKPRLESNSLGNINLFFSIKKLKRNLKKFKNKKKLFIANWSLSEVPLNLREELKFIFNEFDYQIISFQNNFENINNYKYFNKINLFNKSKNRNSLILDVDNYRNNCYMFSKKN